MLCVFVLDLGTLWVFQFILDFLGKAHTKLRFTCFTNKLKERWDQGKLLCSISYCQYPTAISSNKKSVDSTTPHPAKSLLLLLYRTKNMLSRCSSCRVRNNFPSPRKFSKKVFRDSQNCFIFKLEDDPRFTPGHSKALNP